MIAFSYFEYFLGNGFMQLHNVGVLDRLGYQKL